MKLSKNKKKQIEGLDFNKSYPILEAVKLLKEKNYVKECKNTWTPLGMEIRMQGCTS